MMTKPVVSNSVVALGFSMWLVLAGLTQAAVLDPQTETDALLLLIAAELDAAGVDVASNLNDREVIRQRLERPRLGRFADLPGNAMVKSEELENWETAYSTGQEIGAVAILLADGINDASGLSRAQDSAEDQFLSQWLAAPDPSRYFVSFHISDQQTAALLADIALGHGLQLMQLLPGLATEQAGRLYATASQRLALDSRQARSYRSDITEFEYLGERVRRNTNSLFRDDGNKGNRRLARNEPSVFLKETLGDEFTRPTVREIIVPGGVALGETARLPGEITAMRFADNQLYLVDSDQQQWLLPAIDAASVKALFDFVSRSEAIGSDAIVDIDGQGRVRISSALRDTDPGFAITLADTQPFEFVDNLDVTKSVIVDMAVQWRVGDTAAAMSYSTDFEVRFLSADNMRMARTQAALEYEYDSTTGLVSFQDSWGRDAPRLSDKVDFAGLGMSVIDVARYAGWVALFRNLTEQQIRFVDGRYEFLKIDKSGEPTPGRI